MIVLHLQKVKEYEQDFIFGEYGREAVELRRRREQRQDEMMNHVERWSNEKEVG